MINIDPLKGIEDDLELAEPRLIDIRSGLSTPIPLEDLVSEFGVGETSNDPAERAADR